MVSKNKFSKSSPILTTGIVASMLEITPDRLRTYDAENLISTHRIKTGQVHKRLYSQYDVEWLQSLRELVKTYKMSISSIKILLQIIQKNPNIILPNNKIGNILLEMTNNPNFEKVVKKFKF